MAKDLTEQIKETSRQRTREIRDPRKAPERASRDMLLSSGSTLLNCACSDTPWGAFKKGTIVTEPGTSQGGKTMAILTHFAEAIRNPDFKDHDLFYDNGEVVLDIDVEYLFGKKTKEAIQNPPLGHSDTVQKFKANIMTQVKKETPFIWALDSWDSLSSDEELEKEFRKAMAMAKSAEAADKIAGSYGMEKAKIAGQTLRMINNMLEETGSILFIVQQLRQNTKRINPQSPMWKTSGGEAPYFYSEHQVWYTKQENLKSKSGLRIGSSTSAKTMKNKLTGKYREVHFDIYYDYGIDDMSSCIDYLIEQEHWKERKSKEDGKGIVAIELDLCLPRKKLIEEIEQDKSKIQIMKRTVGEIWNIREEEIRLHRKPRYD